MEILNSISGVSFGASNRPLRASLVGSLALIEKKKYKALEALSPENEPLIEVVKHVFDSIVTWSILAMKNSLQTTLTAPRRLKNKQE